MTAEQATTLLSLPTLLWSGVIAAVVSLAGAVGGVVLSNRSSERRLLTQLRHDAAEKQRDRVAALRKEVYLTLFEELSSVSGHLGALAGKDPVTENLGAPLQGVMSQLGKVQLVGAQQTALLAGELSSLYGESLFRLLLAAKPMHELKIDINISDKAFHEQMAEAQRINQEIRLINESGDPNRDRLQALQSSFDHFQQQYEDSLAKRSAAWDSFNALQQPFMAAIFAELKIIGPAQANLMAAMREEIGLISDPEFMLERLEATQQRMRDAADNLLAQLAPD
jgi:hypothetical protein